METRWDKYTLIYDKSIKSSCFALKLRVSWWNSQRHICPTTKMLRLARLETTELAMYFGFYIYTCKLRARGHQCCWVSQRPFHMHNRIALWAKKYICFSYKVKTNKLKPRNSEGEVHSFISYWTFWQGIVELYMQISVTLNVYVRTQLIH